MRVKTLFAGLEREALVIDDDEAAAARNDRPRRREIERDDRDLLLRDVAPDIELRPVGQREHANGFAGADAAIVDVPKLGPLFLRIPDVIGGAEREDALLGAAALFVAAGAAEGGIETVRGQAPVSALRSS